MTFLSTYYLETPYFSQISSLILWYLKNIIALCCHQVNLFGIFYWLNEYIYIIYIQFIHTSTVHLLQTASKILFKEDEYFANHLQIRMCHRQISYYLYIRSTLFVVPDTHTFPWSRHFISIDSFYVGTVA